MLSVTRRAAIPAMTYRPVHRAVRLSFRLWGLLCFAIAASITHANELTIQTPFGIGADAHTGRNIKDYQRWIPAMSRIGVTVYRCGGPGWGDVEKKPGQWTWSDCDANMDYLDSQHITYGGILMGIPPWKKTKWGLPMEDLPAWSDYVSHVVAHCKGRIKYWEVWNEPPNFIAKGQTAADYAAIVRTAYDAAHAADPNCLVGLAAKSVHVNWLEQTILAGAKDHFDYITLHPYETLGAVTEDVGYEPVFLNIVPTVRKMLAAQDPARANVPIIFTEIGSDAGKDPDKPAAALVKAYAMAIAQGVTCVDWFEGMDGDSGPMGLLKADGTPRPACTAYAQILQHLGAHPAYLGWLLLHGKDYGFVFQGAKSTVLIAWAGPGPSEPLDLRQAASITNPLTGATNPAGAVTLTADPVIVERVPSDLLQQAVAHQGEPLPWGGDYTHAGSISITFGATTVENGLHTMAGRDIAADVIAYGGNARSGDVPGGNAFMVDPGFLTYTPTPIEIRIVVRRNAANDKAGFHLVYESTHGFKSLGWYTVPDNQSWHTVSYKVDDEQFVGMWAFNFLLNSDGHTFDKYEIRSVTVTKLTP